MTNDNQRLPNRCKTLFQKLDDEGVKGAKRMEHLLQSTIQKRNIVDFMVFMYQWNHWESTLSDEEKKLHDQYMDLDVAVISQNLKDRPKNGRDIVQDAIQLYQKTKHKREE